MRINDFREFVISHNPQAIENTIDAMSRGEAKSHLKKIGKLVWFTWKSWKTQLKEAAHSMKLEASRFKVLDNRGLNTTSKDLLRHICDLIALQVLHGANNQADIEDARARRKVLQEREAQNLARLDDLTPTEKERLGYLLWFVIPNKADEDVGEDRAAWGMSQFELRPRELAEAFDLFDRQPQAVARQ